MVASATPSSRVVGLRLVDGTGTVRDLREGDQLLAGRVGLGALGAIASVTLRCVPAFTIHRLDEPQPLDDVLPRLDEHVDAHDHSGGLRSSLHPAGATLSSERTRPSRGPAAGRRCLRATY